MEEVSEESLNLCLREDACLRAADDDRTIEYDVQCALEFQV